MSSTAAPFTSEQYARRVDRALGQLGEAGLDGVLLTPGPDLVYLTGYAPMAVTERITMLVIAAGREPTMIVPELERAEAQAASSLPIIGWSDGEDPYRAVARTLEPHGRYAISDGAWAMHLLGLQAACPDARYVSMTAALPMLRAIKDAGELARLTGAAAAVDACVEELVALPFAGRPERA